MGIRAFPPGILKSLGSCKTWCGQIWHSWFPPFVSRSKSGNLGNPARVAALSRDWMPADLEVVITAEDGSLTEHDIEFGSLSVEGRFIDLYGHGIYDNTGFRVRVDRATLINAMLEHPQLIRQISRMDVLRGE